MGSEAGPQRAMMNDHRTAPPGLPSVTESVALPPRHRVHRMPDSQSHTTGPRGFSFDRPACPRCKTLMMLARIMPGPNGYEYRTFECARCDHSDMIPFSTDPMKSDQAGRQYRELEAPE